MPGELMAFCLVGKSVLFYQVNRHLMADDEGFSHCNNAGVPTHPQKFKF